MEETKHIPNNDERIKGTSDENTTKLTKSEKRKIEEREREIEERERKIEERENARKKKNEDNLAYYKKIKKLVVTHEDEITEVGEDDPDIYNSENQHICHVIDTMRLNQQNLSTAYKNIRTAYKKKLRYLTQKYKEWEIEMDQIETFFSSSIFALIVLMIIICFLYTNYYSSYINTYYSKNNVLIHELIEVNNDYYNRFRTMKRMAAGTAALIGGIGGGACAYYFWLEKEVVKKGWFLG